MHSRLSMKYLLWMLLFYAGIAGAATVEHRLGLRYILPLLVDMDLYLTDEGDLEAALETELQLTTRVQAHWEWESAGEYHLRGLSRCRVVCSRGN